MTIKNLLKGTRTATLIAAIGGGLAVAMTGCVDNGGSGSAAPGAGNETTTDAKNEGAGTSTSASTGANTNYDNWVDPPPQPLRPPVPVAPTSMDTAIGDDDVERARVLLDAGFDVNEQDVNGFSALHKACRTGRVEIVRLLIERGADLNARARLNVTPLHWAARSNELEIVKILIEAGAYPNPRGGDDNMHTPTSLAASLGYMDVVDYLLSIGGEM